MFECPERRIAARIELAAEQIREERQSKNWLRHLVERLQQMTELDLQR